MLLAAASDGERNLLLGLQRVRSRARRGVDLHLLNVGMSMHFMRQFLVIARPASHEQQYELSGRLCWLIANLNQPAQTWKMRMIIKSLWFCISLQI